MHKAKSSVKLTLWLPEDDAAAKSDIVRAGKLLNRYIQRLRQAAQWIMGNHRAWLLLCLAATGGLALLILLQTAFFIDQGHEAREQAEKYAVYIDGGSSGTRVRVFRYLPAQWPSYVQLVLPEPSHSVEPGLSAFATEPEKAAASLVPLLTFAYEHVPPAEWHLTPVRLLATAGLRLLTNEEQDAILAACERLLMGSRFLFNTGWATVIDGEMEGLFGWAAVNYITGALQRASGHTHHSRKEVLDPTQLFTGLLEMGGASMQVTFLPPAYVKLPESHGAHLRLPGVPSRLYTHSYLGLGMDSALARATEYTRQHRPLSLEVADPCLPIGYVAEDGRHGNGSFAQCLAVVHQIMPEHNCSGHIASAGGGVGSRSSGGKDGDAVAFAGYADDPAAAGSSASGSGSAGCVLQGSYVPALAGQFVAVENFAWTARALGLPENATLRQLRDSGRRYCATHWSSLHAQFSGHIPDQFLVRYCFGAAYILALLHHGFGLGLDDSRLRWTNTVREGGDGAEVGLNWVLGAAVVNAMSGSGRAGRRDGYLRFRLRDEYGIREIGPNERLVLLLPLAGLVALAAFIGVALLRASRGGKPRPLVLSPVVGLRSGSASLFASRGGPGSNEDRSRMGGSGVSRGGGVSTAWPSSSLLSDAAAGRPLPAKMVKDAADLDPGIGSSVGAGAVRGAQGTLLGDAGVGQAAASEGSVGGSKHGGVLKAAAQLGSAMRRNPSFTSVFVGLDGGTSQ